MCRDARAVTQGKAKKIMLIPHVTQDCLRQHLSGGNCAWMGTGTGGRMRNSPSVASGSTRAGGRQPTISIAVALLPAGPAVPAAVSSFASSARGSALEQVCTAPVCVQAQPGRMRLKLSVGAPSARPRRLRRPQRGRRHSPVSTARFTLQCKHEDSRLQSGVLGWGSECLLGGCSISPHLGPPHRCGGSGSPSSTTAAVQP